MRGPGRSWLPSDTALWHTCRIVSEVMAGRVPEHQIDTLFPVGPGTHVLATGNLRVDGVYALGDGSYQKGGIVAAGTGGLGLAMLAGSLAYSANATAKARAQAEADARVQWRPLWDSVVFVSNNGILIQKVDGIFPWLWTDIILMQVAAYNVVIMQGQSSDGAVTWALKSEWSELIFALWALNRHPNHPQLRDGSWLPDGWLPWAAAQGYPSHLHRPELGS